MQWGSITCHRRMGTRLSGPGLPSLGSGNTSSPQPTPSRLKGSDVVHLGFMTPWCRVQAALIHACVLNVFLLLGPLAPALDPALVGSATCLGWAWGSRQTQAQPRPDAAMTTAKAPTSQHVPHPSPWGLGFCLALSSHCPPVPVSSRIMALLSLGMLSGPLPRTPII